MSVTINGTTGITTPDVTSDGLTVDTTTLVVDETNNRVGIGTASPDTNNIVTISGATPNSKLLLTGGTSQNGLTFGGAGGGNQFYLYSQSGGFAFYDETAAAERMRIDSSGNLLVGTTTSSVATDQGIVLTPSEGYLANNSTTTSGISLILLYSSVSTADQTKFEVNAAGDVKSRTNSYAGFSDERLKQNITPSASQWADIKNIEVVKFQMKSEQFSDEENPWMLGVVAQQVEQVSPGLVDVDPKDDMKVVKYSILYMKAVKALQEAMQRIETLEAQNVAFEARISALEGAAQ